MASIPPPKGLRPSPWGGVPLSCGNLMRSRSAVDVIECLAEFAAQGSAVIMWGPAWIWVVSAVAVGGLDGLADAPAVLAALDLPSTVRL